MWRAVEPFPAGRLATKLTGGPADAQYISARMCQYLASIGLKGLTLHKFRHWYATTMLKPERFGGGGASLRTVQELLGHANVATTAGYTAVSDEERAAATAALPVFTSAPAPR